MSLRRKIVIIMIPVTLIAIALINLTFSIFFSNYLKEQEQNEIADDCNSLYNYINDKKIGYIGSVNDWGHWDDTYDFIQGRNPSFPDMNLNEEDFLNLNVNFFVFMNHLNIVYKKYYNFETGRFSNITDSFIQQIGQLFNQGDNGSSGLYYIDGDFYYIASTVITDSLGLAAPSGKLVIGRKIDRGVLQKTETVLHLNIESMDLIASDYTGKSKHGLAMSSFNENKDSIIYQCLMPAKPNTAVITLSKSRNLYITGIARLYGFLIINVIAVLIILISIFIIIGLNMSVPFVRMINEVSKIDIGKIEKIKVQGKYEFAFLEKTINRLLEGIENEQSKLRESEEKLYATLLSVGDGVIVVDRDLKIQFINPVAEELTGWRDSSALGMPFDEVFVIINEYTRKPAESPVKKAFKQNAIIQLVNHTLLISKDRQEIPIEDSAAPIWDKAGQTTGCVLVFRDFSERRRKQREIEYLSYHDQLTGLYNRRYFEEKLKLIDVEENLPITIIYADVNGLKTLNDAFGHGCGDELVKSIAGVLMNECRGDDLIARTGGDEFVLVLPNTPLPQSISLARRIHSAVEKITINEIAISISLGGKTKESADEDIWDILKTAEDNMYKRKIFYNASQRSSIIKSILNTLKLKSPREDAHSKRVSALCGAIARAYDLGDYGISELKTAGELHDIGKIAIDEQVLNKPGKLDEIEWEQIRRHPETGFRLLSTSNEFFNLAEYVLAHHERWDGAGYPKGQRGEEINWQARVIAVADSYDAMTCQRPYRTALTRQQAIVEIKKNAGTQFDPDIARIFIEKVLGERWDDI